MANNGYMQGNSCVPVSSSSDIASCPLSGAVIIGYFYNPDGSVYKRICYTSGLASWAGYPTTTAIPNCEISGPKPPSTIPTVLDGITLGWQAGGALILVGCILFLRKALIK
jgi:hypothetical protein